MADQNSYVPSQSAALGGVSGAAAFVLIWVLGLFKIPVTPEVASAFTVLAAAVVAYFTNGGRAAHTVKENANTPSGV